MFSRFHRRAHLKQWEQDKACLNKQKGVERGGCAYTSYCRRFVAPQWHSLQEKCDYFTLTIYTCHTPTQSFRIFKEKHGNSKKCEFRSKIVNGLLKDSKCHINSLEGFFPYVNATVAITSVFTSITQVIWNKNFFCSILHCKGSARNILTDAVSYILTPAILHAHFR
jgi:hypothetical protein